MNEDIHAAIKQSVAAITQKDREKAERGRTELSTALRHAAHYRHSAADGVRAEHEESELRAAGILENMVSEIDNISSELMRRYVDAANQHAGLIDLQSEMIRQVGFSRGVDTAFNLVNDLLRTVE